MNCQYCHNNFKNSYTLKTHQTKTKYCLKLQGLTNIVGEYCCEYCNKDFTLRSSLQDHYDSCKANTKYVRKYKAKCIDLEKKVEILQKQLEEASTT